MNQVCPPSGTPDTNFMRRINEIFAQVYAEKIAPHAPRMPRYSYWRDSKKNLYAWTTERDSDGYFWAIRYRYFKTKREWHPKQKVRFRTRRKAKARAWKWYEKATQKPKEAQDLKMQMEGLVRIANKHGFLMQSFILPTHRIVARNGETLELTLEAV